MLENGKKRTGLRGEVQKSGLGCQYRIASASGIPVQTCARASSFNASRNDTMSTSDSTISSQNPMGRLPSRNDSASAKRFEEEDAAACTAHLASHLPPASAPVSTELAISARPATTWDYLPKAEGVGPVETCEGGRIAAWDMASNTSSHTDILATRPAELQLGRLLARKTQGENEAICQCREAASETVPNLFTLACVNNVSNRAVVSLNETVLTNRQPVPGGEGRYISGPKRYASSHLEEL